MARLWEENDLRGRQLLTECVPILDREHNVVVSRNQEDRDVPRLIRGFPVSQFGYYLPKYHFFRIIFERNDQEPSRTSGCLVPTACNRFERTYRLCNRPAVGMGV
jgi:hypothetical protein